MENELVDELAASKVAPKAARTAAEGIGWTAWSWVARRESGLE